MNTSHISIILPELYVRYLEFTSHFPFSSYSRKVLKTIDHRIEAHIPMRSYFNEDWNIKKKEADAFLSDCNSGHIKNSGAYHGMIGIAPPGKPQNNIRLGDVADIEKNTKALKAQIQLSRMLSDKTQIKRALLVVHLDSSRCNENIEKMTNDIVSMFLKVMPLADKLNVHITIEVDILTPYSNCFGSSYENIGNVVSQVNAFCKKNSFHQYLGITFDFSHTIINVLGDFEKVHSIIDTYRDMIDYAHINFPHSVPRTPIDPHSKKMPRFLFNLRSGLNAIESADTHGKIYGHQYEKEVQSLITKLITRTNISKTGIINLELSPKPLYFHHILRGGATAREAFKSINFLQDLMRTSSA